MSGPRVGDRVQIPGQGLGTLERELERDGRRFLFVRLDTGSGVAVPVEEAAMIWRLPTPEEAERLRRALMTPAAPARGTWSERYAVYEAAITRGSRDDQARVLREALARGPGGSFGERKIRLVLQDNVIAPIAEALGLDPAALAEELAAFHAANALDG